MPGAPPQPSDRRRRLLHAARKLFGEQGYEATTILDVAREAGFSKRTVYLDFSSKDALFAAVCAEGMAELRARLQAVLDYRLPVQEELEALAQAYLTFSEEEHALFRLLFVLADDETLPAGHDLDAFEAEERAAVATLARALDRARADGLLAPEVDSWRLAVLAWSALTGVLTLGETQRRASLAGAPVDQLYWQTFRILLRGNAPS